jgi:translation initiation factor IF-1
MVKNVEGGCRTKSQGRKFSSAYASKSALRLAEDPLEIYAVVTKLYGQGRCQVHAVSGMELQCVIRNKFRGRSKRNNIVAVGSILLVGLREWEGPDRYKTCDVLEVYDVENVNQLRSHPNTNVDKLEKYIQQQLGDAHAGSSSSSAAADNIVFTDDADVDEVPIQKLPAKDIDAIMEERVEDEIDIDDI